MDEKEKWWHNTIGYQIYPKSFQDTNGDGIGDIQGIIAHLDELQELGINVIWISPVNASPMVDHGYDISDYYRIDPTFGSEEDIEQLIFEADKRGIKLLMDLVINHTSDQHEWFQKALADPEGKYGDYYIIREGINGGPPNNWRSIFGGSAWERIPNTDKYYLHIFTKGQPDLNWENPELRNELYQMTNYWLEKGLGGFRIDAISHIKKDWSYQPVCADGSDGLVDGRPYYRNVEGIQELLRDLSEHTFKKYDSFTLAEIDDIKPEHLEDFIGEDGIFSTFFDFCHRKYYVRHENYAVNPIQMVEEIKQELFKKQEYAYGKGFLTNYLENHDKVRCANKYVPERFIGFTSQSLLAVIYLFLRGIPVIYQGQEIGMLNYPKATIDGYLDTTTHVIYEDYLSKGMSEEEAMRLTNISGRENSRTPMQWNTNKYAGFSEVEPWFAVNPNYTKINYEDQQKDPNSLLNFYKKAIQLRKNDAYERIFVYGKTEPMYQEMKGCIAYRRVLKEKQLKVLTNCTAGSMQIALTEPIYEVLLNNYAEISLEGRTIDLAPGQAIVYR